MIPAWIYADEGLVISICAQLFVVYLMIELFRAHRRQSEGERP